MPRYRKTLSTSQPRRSAGPVVHILNLKMPLTLRAVLDERLPLTA